MIRQLRLLQLPPFLLRRAILKVCFERQQPITHCWVCLDIDFALRRVDQPKTFRLDAPALDILAAQKGLQQLRRIFICLDQSVARRRVDDEGFVQPCLDAVKRRAIDFAQRFAARRDLVAQQRQRLILEAP